VPHGINIPLPVYFIIYRLRYEFKVGALEWESVDGSPLSACSQWVRGSGLSAKPNDARLELLRCSV